MSIQSNRTTLNDRQNYVCGQSVVISQSDGCIVGLYAQTYLQLQKYYLKRNLWECKMSQQEYQFQFKYHLNKVEMKYKQVENKLQHMINQLKTHLIIAQANQLRSINNILIAYLKRVGILKNNLSGDNNQIDSQEQWVMEQLILDPFNYQPQFVSRINSISSIIDSLTNSLQHQQSITPSKQQKQKQSSQSFFSSTKQLFQILNSTQIHLFPKYQLFQNNLITLSRVAQEGFQLLNGYLNKLEEMATRKVCLEIQTIEELKMEEIIRQSKTKKQQQSYMHIEERNSNSSKGYFGVSKSIPKKHKRKENIQYNNLGRMFNKKKGRQVISHHNINSKRQLTLITDSFFSQDGEPTLLPKHLLQSITDDQLKQFYKCDNILRQRFEQCPDSQFFNQNYYYRDYKKDDQWKRIAGCEYNNRMNNFNMNGNQWGYEDYNHEGFSQRYKQNNNNNYLQQQFLFIEQILQRTYPTCKDIHSLYNYDPFGTNPNFSLIHPLSSMLQQRIVFESTHESIVHRTIKTILMNVSQTKNKAEKYIMEKERKQAESKLNIEENEKKDKKDKKKERTNKKGLSWQLNNQQEGTYSNKLSSNNKPITDLVNNANNTQLQSDQKNKYQEILNGNVNQTITNPKQTKTEKQLKEESAKVQSQKINNESICKQGESTLNQVTNKQTNQSKSQEEGAETPPSAQNPPHNQLLTPPPHSITLFSTLIEGYFQTVQQKYSRMKKEQKSIKQTPWEYLHQQIDTIERVFVVIQSPQTMLLQMERLYTLEKELIKSVVYDFGVVEMGGKERDVLRSNVKEKLYKDEVVTFIFKHISVQFLQQQLQTSNQQRFVSTIQNLPCLYPIACRCLLGMLFVLIYQQKIQKDSLYSIKDYYQKGQQLIDQFLSFYQQQTDCSEIQAYTNPQLLFKRVYQNPNISNINYFFQQQTDQGVVFSKLIDVIGKKLEGEREVQVFRVNAKGNIGGIQQEVDEEDSVQKQQQNRMNSNKIVDGNMSEQTENLPIVGNITNFQEQDQTNLTSTYSYFISDISLKRSSSRQQLRHVIYQPQIFIVSTYGQYNNSSIETQMNNNYIQGRLQQQPINKDNSDYYQGQIYDYEEEQEYLGLE